ncbi:MAG: hypothetical protein EHM45_17875 [Desulfobacteraceae bacterium]|nr:MAG: hypothetical protein EHM45_17875 [Desulfobacteraceae bacterium]
MRSATIIKPHSAPTGASGEQGAILIITLLIIAALTALTLAFSEESRVELNLAQFSRETLQARQMAAAGFNLVLTEIDKPAEQKKKEFEETKRDWTQFGPLIFPDPLPDGITVEGRYLDESGKINLAYFAGLLEKRDTEKATDNEKKEVETIREQLKRFFKSLGLEEESENSSLVACLEDWLDPEIDPNLEGAEDDYYLGLPNPYPCGDGPLLTIDQIYLVKGFEELKGNDENGQKKITDFLTIYGDERGRININSAPKEVLQSLSDNLNVEAVIEYRQKNYEITDINDVPEHGLDAGELARLIYRNEQNRPACYSIELKIKVQEAEVHLKAVVKIITEQGQPKKYNTLYWRIM